MSCVVRSRSKLTRDTSQLVKLVADACGSGTFTDYSDAYLLGRRAVAEADPNSGYLQAAFAIALTQSLSNVPQAARPARIAEAEAALKRGEELGPKEPILWDARFRVARAKGASLIEQEANLQKALTELEGKDPYWYADVNLQYSLFTNRVGRWRDSQTYRSVALSNNPLTRLRDLGNPLAMNGQASQAQAMFEQDFARDPTAEGWEMWTSAAVFLGVGDVEAMLKSPPSMIPRKSVDCWRDIHTASISKDSRLRDLGAKTAARCGAAGDLSTASTLGSLAALGDLDAAVTLAGKQPLNTSSRTLAAAGLEALFWPTSRAMRADPRFLPLVEKLGLMEYWRATKSQPDACETEDVPFCRELKKVAQP